MFCQPLEGGPEVFKSKLAELGLHKTDGSFMLDHEYISSLSKVRSLISFEGTIQIYQPLDQVKGRIHAGLQFNGMVALLQIDVAPPQCFMIICAQDETFRNVVASSIIDIIGKNVTFHFYD